MSTPFKLVNSKDSFYKFCRFNTNLKFSDNSVFMALDLNMKIKYIVSFNFFDPNYSYFEYDNASSINSNYFYENFYKGLTVYANFYLPEPYYFKVKKIIEYFNFNYLEPRPDSPYQEYRVIFNETNLVENLTKFCSFFGRFSDDISMFFKHYDDIYGYKKLYLQKKLT